MSVCWGATEEEAFRHSLCRAEMGTDRHRNRKEVCGVFRVRGAGNQVAGNEERENEAFRME